MAKTIDLTPRNKLTLTPKEYISASKKDRRNFRSSRFIPPSIGDKNFGYFVVTLKHPAYSDL